VQDGSVAVSLRMGRGSLVTHQLFDKGDEGLEIFLEREMELIAVLEVDRDCLPVSFMQLL